ncbi:MAG: hypothetical protein WAM15_05865, partial [Candidatus Acidiferrales bacterium]
MAGVYGEINSRNDFHRVLREATDIVQRILAHAPENPIIQRIGKQLGAMRRWTDNERVPSEGERRNID